MMMESPGFTRSENKRILSAELKAVLSDLEKMTPDGAVPGDYVDLAETSEFKPEIQEGECSA